jgi:hypothetical protein
MEVVHIGATNSLIVDIGMSSEYRPTVNIDPPGQFGKTGKPCQGKVPRIEKTAAADRPMTMYRN